MQPGQGGQQQPGQNSGTSEFVQPDTDRGGAITLFAVVNADGDLDRDFRAVSAQRLARGQYEVVFNRNVSRCAYVATIGDPGDDVVPPAGEISVAGRFGDDNAVFVATYNSNGSPANRGFHLAVHCRPNS